MPDKEKSYSFDSGARVQKKANGEWENQKRQSGFRVGAQKLLGSLGRESKKTQQRGRPGRLAKALGNIKKKRLRPKRTGPSGKKLGDTVIRRDKRGSETADKKGRNKHRVTEEEDGIGGSEKQQQRE